MKLASFDEIASGRAQVSSVLRKECSRKREIYRDIKKKESRRGEKKEGEGEREGERERKREREHGQLDG